MYKAGGEQTMTVQEKTYKAIFSLVYEACHDNRSAADASKIADEIVAQILHVHNRFLESVIGKDEPESPTNDFTRTVAIARNELRSELRQKLGLQGEK
jgi:hypothetical protein